MSRRVRWWLGAGMVALVALGGLYQLLLHRLAAVLHDHLGPRASVGAISVDWNGLTVQDLRLAAAPGWPAPSELSARRVFVQPALRSLFSGPWQVHSIVVDGATLSLLRGRDGKLRLLPGLLPADSAAAPPAAPARVRPAAAVSAAGAPTEPDHPTLVIREVQLRDLQIDFYDDSLKPVRAKPHHLQLDELDASIGNLQLPALNQPLTLKLRGLLRGAGGGANHDGDLRLDGELTPATHDADLSAQLKGVDLRVLQPYLLKVAEGGIQRGQLDLQLKAVVKDEHLHAPGRVTLNGLALNHSGNWWDGLGTASRQAVLDTMAHKGQLDVSFTLEGRLDDPNFSINDSLAKRFASGMAEAVGVSVGGVVEGVGQMFKGLLGR
ncbi:DUF748 domain-containing protein [Ideonella sp.]|uniref:DUF748 domain-containing protein n=1 Tax=Ideonella sp. TaxID=1929293 RepID=UPI00351AC111